ncbi:LysR family transcriptional regulator [Pseudomonas veronii]|uniref:LysR family transcriptional regulator n=1 Tax=Pseudomonas veronii TaxID=76761 RepID=UPI0009A552EE|nr:LysR substrate-binding domain-containing protein [Pseudomonas veronii]AQY65628.1 LysR family transcriptional regulator [Pseudomonas veronii]
MKLNQLRALVMTADCGSIRAAARKLAVSQTAVAKALRELEEHLQLPLLVRNASGVVLTRYGQSLLQHARQMLCQLERARLELSHLSNKAEGQLRLGISPWMGLTLLPEVVTLFRERMPRVRLEIFEGLMAVALPRLRDGTMEFAVGLVSASLPRPEFVSDPLFAYQMSVVARHDHPLRASRSIHELLEQDWVVNYPDASHDVLMTEIFWQHGAHIDVQRIQRVQSVQLTLSLVAQTDMLSYFPRPILTVPMFSDRVQCLELIETNEKDIIGIVTPRNAQLGVAAQCFVDCLTQVIRRRARSANMEDVRLFDTLDLLI